MPKPLGEPQYRVMVTQYGSGVVPGRPDGTAWMKDDLVTRAAVEAAGYQFGHALSAGVLELLRDGEGMDDEAV